VVGHESPGIDSQIPLQTKIRQPGEKIFPVYLFTKYLCPLDPSPLIWWRVPGAPILGFLGMLSTLNPEEAKNKLF